MKKDILKTAGVKSEKEFYKKYPTEEAFIAAHPDFANKMQMGGTREAFPQTATMDNFFSYGVPAPPNYLAHGGMPHAFPQAQTESQFFIPIYTDVYNPYNKEQGGSMPEMFPQVGKVEYQPPANMWFQEGGEQLEEVGVQNRLGKFMAQIGERAATAANKQVGRSAMGMMRAGGNLRQYDPGGQAPGKYKSVTDFVTQNPLDAYTGTQFQYDPAYADAFSKYIDSMYRDYYELDPDHTVYKDDPIYKQLSEAYGYKGKPTSTSTSTTTSNYDINQEALNRTSRGRGPVKSKGYVNGQFGRGRNNDYMWQTMFNTDNFAEAQRLADKYGMTIEEDRAGLLGRRKKYTYDWGNQSVPGTTNPNEASSQTTAQTTSDQTSETTSNNSQQDPVRPKRNFFGRPDEDSRWAPDNRARFFSSKVKNVELPMYESTFETQGYKDLNRNPDFRNWRATERLNRIGERLDKNYQREAGLNTLYGTEMSNRMERLRNRDTRRFNRIADRFDRDSYTQPTFNALAYGGVPMAKWGLDTDHNQIIEKGNGADPNYNHLVEKGAWWDKAAEDYGGEENFYQRQMKKGIATDILNMNQPDFNTYIEDMYPAPGTTRGTFDVLNYNNMPYKNNYAVKDDFVPGFKAGGNYRKGDVIYWDEDTINAFIQAGGQVEYLD